MLEPIVVEVNNTQPNADVNSHNHNFSISIKRLEELDARYRKVGKYNREKEGKSKN
jgi:hypothetical protein